MIRPTRTGARHQACCSTRLSRTTNRRNSIAESACGHWPDYSSLVVSVHRKSGGKSRKQRVRFVRSTFDWAVCRNGNRKLENPKNNGRFVTSSDVLLRTGIVG